MSDIYRVGRSPGTTIYRNDEPQPCAWVPNDRELAERIVGLLNAFAKELGLTKEDEEP